MMIKICGITNSSDAIAALETGADWLGLNFVAGPRKIDLAQAGKMIYATNNLIDKQGVEPPRRLKPAAHEDNQTGSKCFAPFVALVRVGGDEQPQQLEELLTKLKDWDVTRLQLYGDIAPSVLKDFRSRGFETILVWPVGDKKSLEVLGIFLESATETPPDYVLCDAQVPGALGGSGYKANWRALAEAHEAGRFAHWPPIILAGGLTPENVIEAIKQVRPAGVDVSSGVESTPGHKDHNKLRAFCRAVSSV